MSPTNTISKFARSPATENTDGMPYGSTTLLSSTIWARRTSVSGVLWQQAGPHLRHTLDRFNEESLGVSVTICGTYMRFLATRITERGVQTRQQVAESWSHRARGHILVAKKRSHSNQDKVGKLKDFQKSPERAPALQAENGDLSWFERTMVKAFEDAVWDTPVATVSPPVKTQFEHHLIWVHGKRRQAVLSWSGGRA